MGGLQAALGVSQLKSLEKTINKKIDQGNYYQNNLDIIGHMQIADHPGRHQPGTGEINYSFLMEYLDQIEYKNWVGCEYYPKGHSKKSLEWAADWL